MACEKIVQRIGCKEDCTKNLSDFHFRALYTYIYISTYIYIYVEPFFINRTADRVLFLRGRLVGSNHLDFAVKFDMKLIPKIVGIILRTYVIPFQKK